MKKSFNAQLKASARIILDGKHGFLAAITLLLALCNVFFNYILSSVFHGSGIFQLALQFICSILINVILYLLFVGKQRLYLNLCRNEMYGYGDLFSSFTGHPEQIAIYSLIQYLMQTILFNSLIYLVSHVWFLGFYATIFAFLAYAAELIAFAFIQISLKFVLCLFVDQPYITVKDAIKESIFMMKGRKWKLIRIYLSFIGMDVLVLLSFGIGSLFVEPYQTVTLTLFYMDARGETF